MPTMTVWKGWDKKWHTNPCRKTDLKSGIFILLTGEYLKLGGNGYVKDPPADEMCYSCFPWHNPDYIK